MMRHQSAAEKKMFFFSLFFLSRFFLHFSQKKHPNNHKSNRRNMNDDINDDVNDEKPLAATPLAATTTTTTKNDDDERVENNTSNCASKNANDANTFNEKARMEFDRTQEFPTPETNKLEEKEKEEKEGKEKEDGNDAKGRAEEEAKKDDEEEEKEKKTTNEDEEEKKEEEIIFVLEDWPVSDDFLLIKCVENGCALESLAAPFARTSTTTKGGKHTQTHVPIVNFSKEYALEEIEKRWRGILFGEKSAYEAAKRLREYAEKEAPKVEANVGDDFRTSWKKRRGGEVPRLISGEGEEEDEEDNAAAVNFFKDAELFILTDCDPLPSKAQLDETLKRQESKRKERNIHKIAKLEKDLTTVASRAMTRSGIIAKIIGQNTMFTLTKRESTVGRSTTDSAVDVDLSKEGNAAKISRVQAYLKLRWNGEFTLRNVGKRPIWINNKPIETNQRARLHSHALIEVGGMRMLFVPNPSLVRCIQPESYK